MLTVWRYAALERIGKAGEIPCADAVFRIHGNIGDVKIAEWRFEDQPTNQLQPLGIF